MLLRAGRRCNVVMRILLYLRFFQSRAPLHFPIVGGARLPRGLASVVAYRRKVRPRRHVGTAEDEK